MSHHKVSEAVKRHLKENYERVANMWLLELLNMWELDSVYGFWVSDEVGGTYCYGDNLFFQMDDIIFCVMNDVEEKEYREWTDYNSWAMEFNQPTHSLKAWHMGCPRHTKEEMEHLRTLKREFEELCKEYAEDMVKF